jgi:hypothetical protein
VLKVLLTDEYGWTWFIPLHDGTVSVGVVINQEKSNAKKTADKAAGKDTFLTEFYKRQIKHTPNIVALLGDAALVKKPDVPLVNSASDYSYQASHYAGPHYRLVGDAGGMCAPHVHRPYFTFSIAFIDPYFFSGVHLAIAGATTATASICATLREEKNAQSKKLVNGIRPEWKPHTRGKQHISSQQGVQLRHTSYCRFLLVVLSAYKQIRAQSAAVLATDYEDNFDRAFDFFRPIIQGNTDTGKKLAGDALNQTIRFLAQHAFEPSQLEERAALISKHGDPLEKLPVASLGDTEKEIRSKAILRGVGIRKLMRTEDILRLDNFVTDHVGGFKLRLKRDALVLDKA